ncbi:putative flavonoid 3'-monooxygenase [Helianthus annuus]|nr:putative flavonoid 3'-monooxygenase [Helianthus annuus]
MYSFNLPLFLSFIILVGICLWKRYTNERHGNKLPPGPIPLPVIGSLHLLGKLPHRALHKLSKKHGSIMSIRLGNVESIVLSSPDAAKLFLGDHDADVSSRPKLQVAKYLSYGIKGMAYTEYGSHWRALRKLCAMEFFSCAKVNATADIRREEIGKTLDEIRGCSMKNEVVNLTEMASKLIGKTTFKMLFGRKDYGGTEFMKVVHEASEVTGTFNLGDFVPILAPLDLQGLTRRLKSISKAFDDMLESIIADHEQDNQTRIHGPDTMDFIDTLLSIKSKYSDTSNDITHAIDRSTMKAILIDLIVGAIDASVTSIEWVMSVLIRHPRVMKKLQQELIEVVGNKRFVDESNLTESEWLRPLI